MKTRVADPRGRRLVLKMLGVIPLAGGFTLTEAQAQSAHERVARQKGAAAYAPRFFTAHEWDTVRVLVDIVIPRDARSGSATDALVPEFMDFVLIDPLAEPRQRESNQVQMRGGLAWLDRECGRRFSGKTFLETTDAERKTVLDSIAYPKEPDRQAERGATSISAGQIYPNDKTPVLGAPVGAGPTGAPASPENEAQPDGTMRLSRLTHGIAFFNAFRDLTASGFWSSALGVKDIGYVGNTFVAEWKGCPPEVLARLGLTGDKA